MRKLFVLGLLSLFALTVSAQSIATLDSAMRYFRAGKKTEALPFFKRIYAGNDDLLKQRATITVSEYWAANRDSIKREQASADFGNTLIAYVQPLTQRQNLGVNDLYTIGIGALGVISTGTLPQNRQIPFMEMALQVFDSAMRLGHPNASYYMAQVLRRYKRFNKEVPYNDIFAWTDKAVTDRNSMQPLLELVADMGDSWYQKQEADTSRMVVDAAFGITLTRMPDSLHLLVNRVWENARGSFSSNAPVVYLSELFTRLYANADIRPRIGKGFAWHLLYKYMYQGNREYAQTDRDRNRAKIMDTLRNLTGNDPQVLMFLTGDFIASTRAKDMEEYANLQEADWTANAKPPFTGNAGFYRAAVLSGRFYTNLLESDPNAARYSQAISNAYTERLKLVLQYFNQTTLRVPEGYRKNEYEKAFLLAVSTDRMNIQKLRTLPLFAGNAVMKQHELNADIIYLKEFMMLNSAVPQEVDAIMKKLAAVTTAEKAVMDLSYIKDFESDLAFFRALASATKNGIEIETVDPFTRKTNRTKIYVGDEGGKKKDELLAQIRAFLDK